MSKLRKWDAANYLEDEEDRKRFYQLMSEENNKELTTHALKVIERSRLLHETALGNRRQNEFY